MPIGTFTQKMNCQLRPSTMAPPTSGPSAMARPAMAPQAPSTSAAALGGTAADRIVSVSGVTIAAPTPWIARAATDVAGRGERRARRPGR